MNNDKIIELFSKFGEIQKRDEIDSDTLVYLFDCDIKKIMPAKSGLRNSGISLEFVIVHKKESDDMTMIAFRFSDKDSLGENALELVNRVNNSMEFGKFFLDNDGDLNWSISFTTSDISEKSIEDIVRSCMAGLINLVKWTTNKE